MKKGFSLVLMFSSLSIFCSTPFDSQANSSSLVPGETLMVVSVKGEGFEIKSHGELVKLRKGMRIHREGQVEMKDFSLVEFASASGDRLFVYGPSQINFIFLEGDHSLLLNLQRGQMRWISSALRESEKKTGPPLSKVLLKTDLVELELTSSDAGFLYDPFVPKVEVFNMKGNSKLKVRDSFESVQLDGKQKIHFQGVIEEHEIAYDLLLEGKKIPKGILSPPITIASKEEEIFIPRVRPRIQKESKSRLGKNGSFLKEKSKDYVCKKPLGKINQCAWVCEGVSGGKFKNCPTEKKHVECVRRRCDANGEWRDPYKLPKDAGKLKCSGKPIVASCDY